MNKDNKFENTVGIESTFPKDMPNDHGEIPVWNSENWFYEDVIVGHKIDLFVEQYQKERLCNLIVWFWICIHM